MLHSYISVSFIIQTHTKSFYYLTFEVKTCFTFASNVTKERILGGSIVFKNQLLHIVNQQPVAVNVRLGPDEINGRDILLAASGILTGFVFSMP